VEVALGRAHACVRRKNGTIWCWGTNDLGQLGRGTTAPAFSADPQPIGQLEASGLAAGGDTTCATTSTDVFCWGDDSRGQLGRGAPVTAPDGAAPAPVVGLATSVGLALGPGTACSQETTGAVRCWGDNHGGQLGAGASLQRTPVLSAVPAQLSGGQAVAAVSATRVCGRAPGGSSVCVGGDRFLEEGPDDTSDAAYIDNSGPARVLTAGDFFLCELRSGGGVACWGRGDEGQLGVGVAASSNRRKDAVTIPALDSVTSLAAGTAHACAVQAGSVVCWGDCSSGQCGDSKAVGSTPTVASPTLVPGLSGVTKVFAGGKASCALLAAGDLVCWGAVAGGAPSSAPTPIALP
jgi:alpha-tubulin suppressor-like RCC1 family protein